MTDTSSSDDSMYKLAKQAYQIGKQTLFQYYH